MHIVTATGPGPVRGPPGVALALAVPARGPGTYDVILTSSSGGLGRSWPPSIQASWRLFPGRYPLLDSIPRHAGQPAARHMPTDVTGVTRSRPVNLSPTRTRASTAFQ